MDDDTNVNEFLYSMNEIVVYIQKIKTRYFNKNGIKHKYRKRRFNHLSLDSLLLLEMIKDLEEAFEFIKIEERKKETIIFATIVGRIIDDIIKKFNEFSTNLNSIIDNIIDRKLTKEKEAELYVKGLVIAYNNLLEKLNVFNDKLQTFADNRDIELIN